LRAHYIIIEIIIREEGIKGNKNILETHNVREKQQKGKQNLRGINATGTL
jgi:hypothetical protein